MIHPLILNVPAGTYAASALIQSSRLGQLFSSSMRGSSLHPGSARPVQEVDLLLFLISSISVPFFLTLSDNDLPPPVKVPYSSHRVVARL